MQEKVKVMLCEFLLLARLARNLGFVFFCISVRNSVINSG